MTAGGGGVRRVPTAVATGIGSVPGDAPREAARWVVDALPELPHLPELPARGPWASITGRAAGLLVDLPLELELERWRTASTPGRDVRRSRSLLAEDLDAFEEVLQGFTGSVKVQVCGPVTLAATAELRGGDVLTSDLAALRDVAASLAEGVGRHLDDLAKRLPGVAIVLQLDEPGLPAATAGAIPRPSGWGLHPPVPGEGATSALSTVVQSAEAAGASTVVHCCASDPDWAALARSGADALSLDVEALDLAAHATELGQWIDTGGSLWAGVDAVDTDGARRRLRELRGVLGLASDQFASAVAVTPRCGLPGSTVPVVSAAYAATRDLARWLQDGADGPGR
jgi:hypothetical protein